MIRKIATLFILSISTFVWASESDFYDFSWLDKDKEVYVLQNRKFRKKSNFHVNAGYSMTTSGAFVDASAIQGRLGYFFTEELGFEMLFSKNSGSENATAASVRNSGSGSGSIPFRRIVNSYYGLMGMWSPFYSKINTFNKIIYLDVFFGLGVGKIEETNNRSQFDNYDPSLADITETHTAYLWDVGLNFYISELWSVRFDVLSTHYQAQKAIPKSNTESWYQNVDMGISVGLSF